MDGEDIRGLFVRRGLRWTKQREEVYAALAACGEHPTAEELFRLVGGGAEEAGAGEGVMSLATVYNSLEALVRCGLARRLAVAHAGPGAGAAFRYDAEVTDHAHLVGRDGRIHDLPGDLGRRVLEGIPRGVVEEVERRLGVRIARLSVELVESEGGVERPRGPDNRAGSERAGG